MSEKTAGRERRGWSTWYTRIKLCNCQGCLNVSDWESLQFPTIVTCAVSSLLLLSPRSQQPFPLPFLSPLLLASLCLLSPEESSCADNAMRDE